MLIQLIVTPVLHLALTHSNLHSALPRITLQPRTPVLRRENPPQRPKMPSDCYDDSDELDELRSHSPNHSPRTSDNVLFNTMDKKKSEF